MNINYSSSVLKRANPVRVFFDPKNKAHVSSLKTFLETGRWGDVQFDCEPPFISVPEYVYRKYIAHKLGAKDIAMCDQSGADELVEETNASVIKFVPQPKRKNENAA